MVTTSGGFDRRFAVVSGLIVFALSGAGVFLPFLSVNDGSVGASVDFLHLPAVLVLAITGGLIVARRPNNRIGIGLCLLAIAAALVGATEAYVHLGLLGSGSMPFVPVLR